MESKSLGIFYWKWSSELHEDMERNLDCLSLLQTHLSCQPAILRFLQCYTFVCCWGFLQTAKAVLLKKLMPHIELRLSGKLNTGKALQLLVWLCTSLILYLQRRWQQTIKLLFRQLCLSATRLGCQRDLHWHSRLQWVSSPWHHHETYSSIALLWLHHLWSLTCPWKDMGIAALHSSQDLNLDTTSQISHLSCSFVPFSFLPCSKVAGVFDLEKVCQLIADSLVSALLPWLCGIKILMLFRDDFPFLWWIFACFRRCLYLPTLATVLGPSAEQSVSGGIGMGKYFLLHLQISENTDFPGALKAFHFCKK